MSLKITKKVSKKSKTPNLSKRRKDEKEEMEEAFRIRRKAKRGVFHAVWNAYFNPDTNLEDLVKDISKTPIERAYAAHAIRTIESGDAKQLEQICGIAGVSTKAKEIDHSVTSGGYTEFLDEAKKFLNAHRKNGGGGSK